MIRPIALYLPQYHPFPENDEWWGKGFTEWTNVVKSKPKFKGHYQPHLPADLGFYDLRLEESRIAQAELAKTFGIFGFCYYHYWFNGIRLMRGPLDSMLSSGKPDFPFIYCWANENWSRKWDGNEDEILIKQQYSDEDDISHIEYLCKHVFSDPRYIRVNGKPFFIIYRPLLFPDIRQTVKTWRNISAKFGFDLYLGYMQGFNTKIAPDTIGFDAAVEFQPDFYSSVPVVRESWQNKILRALKISRSPFRNDKVIEYREYVESQKSGNKSGYKIFPSVTPMWDNTARRKTGAYILNNSTPDIYENWLRTVIKNFKPFSDEENFVFINAWNEWAEGNHLEPCMKWGLKYLEATKKAFEQNE